MSNFTPNPQNMNQQSVHPQYSNPQPTNYQPSLPQAQAPRYRIFCQHCGQPNNVANPQTAHCGYCGKPLQDKDHLFRDYLIDHTKDQLKGKISDTIYDAIKNYLLSHLYGMLLTVTLVTAASTGIAAANDRPSRVQRAAERPSVVAGIVIHTGEEADSDSATSESSSVTEESVESNAETEESSKIEEIEEVTLPGITPLTYDLDAQLAVVNSNLSILEQSYDSDWWVSPLVCVCDLDQDGLLEITISQTMGSGIFTYYTTYEVDMDNETLAFVSTNEGENATEYYADGMADLYTTLYANDGTPFIGYFDPATGTFYFITYDSMRNGVQYSAKEYYLVHYKDGVFAYETLGYSETYYMIGGESTETFTLADGTAVDSQEALVAAFEESLSGYVKTTYTHSFEYISSAGSLEEAIRLSAEKWSLKQAE